VVDGSKNHPIARDRAAAVSPDAGVAPAIVNSLVPAKPKNYDKHASVPFWPPLWRGPERRAETVHLISRRAVTGKALLR
jgi:hypothetical protein